MKELKNEQLYEVQGGFSFSASFLNSLARSVNSILELGRTFGSSIRRISCNSYCKV